MCADFKEMTGIETEEHLPKVVSNRRRIAKSISSYLLLQAIFA